MCFYPNKNNSMKVIRPISSYVITWRNLGHNYSNELRKVIWLAEITLPVSGRVLALTFRSHSLFAVLVIYFKSIITSLKDHHPNHDFVVFIAKVMCCENTLACSAPAVGHTRMAWGKRTGGGTRWWRGLMMTWVTRRQESNACLSNFLLLKINQPIFLYWCWLRADGLVVGKIGLKSWVYHLIVEWP